MTLTEDNEDPMSQKYQFKLKIDKLVVETIEFVVPINTFEGVTIKEEESEEVIVIPPSFEIEEFTYIGELRIKFSQKMIIVEELSQFTDSVLELTLEPNEFNIIEEPEIDLAFTWEALSFSEREMTIQVTFAKPSFISAGVNRDDFTATVKDTKYFFSAETLVPIPLETSDSVLAPKMMPNSDFTKAFAGGSTSFGNFTNASLVGNFVVNLLLSGAMNLLWGLLHAM